MTAQAQTIILHVLCVMSSSVKVNMKPSLELNETQEPRGEHIFNEILNI